MPDTVLSAEDKVVTDKAFSLKSLHSRRRMVRIGEVISSTNTHTHTQISICGKQKMELRNRAEKAG